MTMPLSSLLFRFYLVGMINTLIGLSSFPTLYYFAHREISYMTIMTISQVFNVSFAFVGSKYLVFQTKGDVPGEMFRFAAYHALVYTLNLIVLPFLVEVWSLTPVVGQTGFCLIVVASSFFWHRHITFARRSAPPAPSSEEQMAGGRVH